MSALDQAFIKAYAKDPAHDSTSPPRANSIAARSPAATPQTSKAPAAIPVEQWYAEGAWYRVEQPTAPAGSSVAVPPPHAVFPRKAGHALPRRTAPAIPSPTSPTNAQELAPPAAIETPQPVSDHTDHAEIDRVEFARGEAIVPDAPQTASTSREFVLPPSLDMTAVAAYTSADDPRVEIEPATEPRKFVRVDVPSAAIPPPHLDVVAAAAQPVPADIGQPQETGPAIDDATVKANAVKANAVKASAFRPVWEVDRFQWPPACEGLLQLHGEQFEHVGQHLLTAAREGRKVLAVISAQRGEGRTTLALCLARWAAHAGARVALVDSDPANPQLAAQLGVQLPCDWQHVLADQLPLAEAAISSVEDRLTLIPLKPKAAHEQVDAAELDTAAMLDKLAAAYDLVLLDVEPVAIFGDVSAAAAEPAEAAPRSQAAVLLVRDANVTTSEQASAVVNFLRHTGIEVVGVVENYVPHENT